MQITAFREIPMKEVLHIVCKKKSQYDIFKLKKKR